jgi:hypothetical protein
MKLVNYLFFFYSFLLLSACSTGNATGVKGMLESLKSDSERASGEHHKEWNGEKLSVADFKAWVEDKENGLRVEKTIGEFTYTLQSKPLEYVALLDLEKDKVSKPELTEKMEEFSGMDYFTFQISTDSQQELLKKNLETTNDYYNRINYFSFEMQKDLKLIEGSDTVNCELFHFERVYGLAPYARFVLGFPKSQSGQEKTFYYNEKIFGSGRIYLTIHAKKNIQLPEVITY